MAVKQNKRVVNSGNKGQETKSKGKKVKNADRFQKLKSLPYYDELKKKIIAGIAPEEVARWIQEDMMGYLDAKRDSLARQLYRFKASIPPGELLREPPMHIRKRIEKLKHGVNEIEELEKLYLLQLTRVNMDVQTEEKINKLFAGTSREIQLAADLLIKMMEKKMSLGILSEMPQKHEFSGGLGMVAVGLNGEIEKEGLDEDKMTQLGLVAGKLISAIVKMKENEEIEDVNAT